MILFKIGRLRQLVDISLVGTVDDRGADLGHSDLGLVQVALAQRVRLVVRQ